MQGAHCTQSWVGSGCQGEELGEVKALSLSALRFPRCPFWLCFPTLSIRQDLCLHPSSVAQSTREALRTTLHHFGLAEDTIQLVFMLGMVPSRRLLSFLLLRPHHLSNHFRWVRAGEDFDTCSSEEHM